MIAISRRIVAEFAVARELSLLADGHASLPDPLAASAWIEAVDKTAGELRDIPARGVVGFDLLDAIDPTPGEYYVVIITNVGETIIDVRGSILTGDILDARRRGVLLDSGDWIAAVFGIGTRTEFDLWPGDHAIVVQNHTDDEARYSIDVRDLPQHA